MDNGKIKYLKKEFVEIRKPGHTGKDYDVFAEHLNASKTAQMLKFHWELIKQRKNLNRPLYKVLCFAFRDRGRSVEAFLSKAALREKNPDLRSEALRILALTRSSKTRLIARQLCASAEPSDRLAAYGALEMFTIAKPDDLRFLLDCLARETRPKLRKELIQVVSWLAKGFGLSVSKKTSHALFARLHKETHEAIAAEIILSLQYLLKKSFGLREVISGDVERVGIRGNIEAAKVRALQAERKM